MLEFYSSTCVLLIAQATFTLVTSEDNGCTKPWVSGNTSCYFLEMTAQPWNNAQINCKNKGGSLVEIEDNVEDHLVHKLFPLHEQNVWLGGTDQNNEGQWRWISGNSIARGSTWVTGQPDNWENEEHCLVIHRDHRKYDDRPCGANYKSLCEKKKTTTSQESEGEESEKLKERPEVADNSCNQPWVRIGKSCYYYEHHHLTWDDAQTNCQNKGGVLAEINDEKQDDIVSRTLNPEHFNLWLGGTDRDKEGQWRWTSGKVITVRSMWYERRPDNWEEVEHCLVMAAPKQWDDYECLRNFRSLCEKRGNGGTVLPVPDNGDSNPQGTVLPVHDNEDSNPQENKCIEPWVTYGTSCYLLVITRLSWHKAQEDCTSKGATLVEIDDKAEDAFLERLISKDKGHTWLGGTDKEKEGVWLWASGKPIPKLNLWKKNEPNNYNNGEHCLQLKRGVGWNDASCNSKHQYVCEIPSDGIVRKCKSKNTGV